MSADDFAGRLDARMREQGLEAIDLAAAVRVNQSTVSRWLDGISKPHADHIAPLAARLDVSVAWLLTGQEQPYDDATVQHFVDLLASSDAAIDALSARRPLRKEDRERLAVYREARDGLMRLLGIAEPSVVGHVEDPAPSRDDLGDLSKKISERANDQEKRRQQRGRRRPPPS